MGGAARLGARRNGRRQFQDHRVLCHGATNRAMVGCLLYASVPWHVLWCVVLSCSSAPVCHLWSSILASHRSVVGSRRCYDWHFTPYGQSARTKVSNKFRDNSSLVLCSSDVSARGLGRQWVLFCAEQMVNGCTLLTTDYPDVTLVIQMGYTTREQYIHRSVIHRSSNLFISTCCIGLVAPHEPASRARAR